MRRFLSLALAVLMVVSSVSLGAVSVSAASGNGTSSIVGSVGAGSNVTINGITGAVGVGSALGSVGASGNIGASIGNLGVLGNVGASGVLGAIGDLGAAIDTLPVGSTAVGATEVTYEVLVAPETATKITTAEEFLAMSPGGVYVLMENITVAQSYGTFKGVLYGNGKTVTTSVPLFKKLDGATVTDLTIKGEIVLDADGGVGALAMTGSAVSVRNVVNDANVTGKNPTGGMIGALLDTSTFEGCVNNGVITATSGDCGGMVGNLNDGVDSVVLTFKDCVNNGKISSKSNAAGGIGWFAPSSTKNKTLIIENCINTGDVTATNRAGGFAGTCYAATLIVDRCTNTGNMTATVASDAGRVGGMVGWISCPSADTYWMITNCKNEGDMSSPSGNAGGIFGHIESTKNQVVIDNCHNVGAINCGKYGGGIVGASWAGNITYRNCLNEGAVTTKSAAGGIVSHQRGTFTHAADKNSGTASGVLVVENCVNKAPIAGTSEMGGLIGRIYDQESATFKNCLNTAEGIVNVAGKNTDCAGILGMVHCDKLKADGKTNVWPSNMVVTFENCYNYAAIKGSRPGGIFGGMNGTIKSMSFDNCYNSGSITATNNYAGGIASRPDAPASFTNCQNDGTIYGANQYAGGIIGYGGQGAKNFTNCLNTGSVTLKPDAAKILEVGGIAGRFNGGGRIVNCLNTGTITGPFNASGIIGTMYGAAHFENCENRGTVISGSKGSGISSRNDNALTMINCLNSGSVTGASEVGGIVAYNATGSHTTTITNCKNTGAITNTATNATGGIAGLLKVNVVITNCENTGSVTSNVATKIGGILGQANAATLSITGCKNSGTLTNRSFTGGIIAYVDGTAGLAKTIQDCINTGAINVDSLASNADSGGISGRIDAGAKGNVTIKNCENTAALVFKGKTRSGGISGNISGENITIENVVNRGSITQADGTATDGNKVANYCAGIVARPDARTSLVIRNALNEGVVKTNKYGGGIVGLTGDSVRPAVAGDLRTVLLENCKNAADFTGGWNSAGIFAIMGEGKTAIDSCTFRNCENTGNITISTTERGGGIVGIVQEFTCATTIENCKNSGDVTGVKAKANVLSLNGIGGIVGVYARGTSLTIKNCENTIDAAISSNEAAGGILGAVESQNADAIWAQNLTIENCTNNGTVSAPGGYAAAGIAGVLRGKDLDVTVKACKNNGAISSTGAQSTAGIVGRADFCDELTIEDCINSATISAYQWGAGILGAVKKNGDKLVSYIGKVDEVDTPMELLSTGTNTVTVKNCQNDGAVTGTYLGGIVAVSYTLGSITVENCTNTADITGTKSVSGTVGHHDNVGDLTIKNCLNTGKATANNADGKDGKPENAWATGFVSRVCKGCDITIENCVNGSATDPTVASHNGGNWTGGIMTSAGGDTLSLTIKNCINYADLAPEKGGVGGIVGYSNSNDIDIKDTVNHGDITAADTQFAVGIIAQADANGKNVYLENCVNNGNIQGSLASGIAGKFWSPVITIESCVNNGAISSNKTAAKYTASGILCELYQAGQNVTVNNSVNNGEIEGGARTGGIIGRVEAAVNNVTVTNCWNKAAITAGTNVGGMIGEFFRVITGKVVIDRCTNSASITGSNYVGGMIGGCWTGNVEIKNSLNNASVTAGNVAAGFIAHIRTAVPTWADEAKTSFTAAGTLSLENCKNAGTIQSPYQPGGIVGRIYEMEAVSFVNCENVGTINPDKKGTESAGILAMVNTDDGSGGKIATNLSLTFTGCKNSGAVYGSNVSGIFSTAYANISTTTTFTNCVNDASGAITANEGGKAAGMVARIGGPLTVTGCTNAAPITGSSEIGGIIGYNATTTGANTITNCKNTGTVTNTAGKTTGGIVGAACGNIRITNCENTQPIVGGDTAGIIGQVHNSVGTLYVENCRNSGSITGGRVGGILGAINTTTVNATIKGCVNTGAILSSNYGGGIAGKALASKTDAADTGILLIENCVNLGTFKVTDASGAQYGGGILGFSGNNGGSDEVILRNCVNGTSATVSCDGVASGIAATINHAGSILIENCTNDAAVSSSAEHAAGFIVNVGGTVNSLTVRNCVNNGAINGKLHAAGGVVYASAQTVLIEQCLNTGTVTGNDKSHYWTAAGIVAGSREAVTVEIKSCQNDGEVKGARFNAGIYGRPFMTAGTDLDKETADDGDKNDKLTSLKISNCVNNGIINKDNVSNNDCGGIVATTEKCATVKIEITDCLNTAAVYGNRPGGILGVSASGATIKGCVNIAAITSPKNYGGGITSRVDGAATFTDCVNTGDVTSGSQYAAGMVAYSASGDMSFTNCYNSGDMSGVNHASGGLVGAISGNGTFTGCVNEGDITATNGHVGGIAGATWASSSYTDCVNTGKINANTTDSKHGGGIAGLVNHNGTFKNCLNNGSVSTANGISGGIVGSVNRYTKIDFCANTGDVTSPKRAAGIVGSAGSNNYGSHYVNGSFSGGKVLNTGAAIANGNTDLTLGVGGICGYAWGCIDVTNCTVASDVVAETNATIASAFIAYSNNGETDVKNNVFLGTISSDLDRCVVEDWYNTSKRPAGNTANYVVTGLDALLYRDNTAGEVAIPADYAFTFATADVASGALTTAMNTTIGAGTFVQNADMPMYKDVVAVYNKTVSAPTTLPAVKAAATGADTSKLPATDATIFVAPTGVTIGSYTNDTTKLGYVAPTTTLATPGTDSTIGTPGRVSTVVPGVESSATLGVTTTTPQGPATSTGITTDLGLNADSIGADETIATDEMGNFDASEIIEISSAEQFLAMKPGGNYKLTADITLPSSYAGIFYGNLDGNGKTVTVSAGPVFEKLVAATVMDLTVAGAVNDTTSDYVGAVAGSANTVILSGITNNANVSGKNAGGLVGEANGLFEVIDSVNNGTVSGTTAGGIAGAVDEMATVVFSGCANEGDIVGGEIAGGIAAVVYGTASIIGAENNGDVSATEGYAGGIVGRAGTDDTASSLKRHVFTDCTNTGDVTSHRQYAGGILGYTGDSAVFTTCRNDGTVTGDAIDATKGTTCSAAGCHTTENTLYLYAGGIAGAVQYEGCFYSCINTGDVEANSRVGGIVGSVGEGNKSGVIGYNEFIGCVTTGDITHNGNYSDAVTKTVGGIFGYAGSPSAYKSLVVAYCGVAGSVSLTRNADTSANVVGGLGGYSNNAAATYENNYVIADVTLTGGGQTTVLPYSPAGAVPATNLGANYTTHADMTYLYDANGFAPVPAEMVIRASDAEDGTLTDTVNGDLGFVAFVQDEALGLPVFDATLIPEVATVPEAITNAEEFAAMDPYGNYYLANDINLPESYAYIFSGILDGRGYKITTSAPLFKELDGASILNVTIDGTVQESEVAVGALANKANNVNLYNVVNLASVTNLMNDTAKESTRYGVGGIVGELTGESILTSCKNSGKISGSAPGGIVGFAAGNITINSTLNNGMITDYSTVATAGGGIIAYAKDGTYALNDCMNTGTIAFASATKFSVRAGGLIGYVCASNATVTLTGCVNGANVIGGDQAGGLIGWAQAHLTITDSTNVGNVISTGNYAGGIVGRVDYNTFYSADTNGDGKGDQDHFNDGNVTTVFTNVVNRGDVFSHRQYAGGMVGYSQISFTGTKCLNTGYVGAQDPYNGLKCEENGCHGGTNTRSIQAGGIVGSVRGNVKLTYCVNTGDVASPVRAAGLIAYAGSYGFGGHTVTGCVNTGNVLNTGALVGASNTDKALGAAGVCAYAYGILDVTNCTVAGNIVTEGNASKTALAAAFICYSNNGDTDVKNNAFLGTLSGDLLMIENWYNTNTRPANAGNYVTEDLIGAMLFRDKNETVNVTDAYAYFYEAEDVASGELAAMLNASAGAGTFVQNDDMPMHKNVVDVYGLKDAPIGSIVPEDALPEAPAPDDSTDTDEGEDTTESDTESDTTVDTTEDITTDEPGNVTTEPDGDVTTEPDGDVTTEKPDDVTTAPADDSTTGDNGTDDEGCGSVIGASAMIMALALAIPTVIVLKKKDEE